MKNKLESINTLPFIAYLALLLLNDFYLKEEYHNWLTGKVSDFCGLFIFVSFWVAIIPNRKKIVYIATGLLFVIWKSPYSQGFIDFFSEHLFSITRVVDATDLIALSILPFAFFFTPKSGALKFNPIPLALLTIFSFCATSIPRPKQKFEQPQYLLFKKGIVNFASTDYPSDYKVYNFDSLVIIDVKKIEIDNQPSIDDEFQKVQILKDLDLRLLRESRFEFRSKPPLVNYEELRDSLTASSATSITLSLDSVTDYLNFRKTRLHGHFKRFSKTSNLLINGKYKNGIEDSIWTYYNIENQITYKKYFENGELTKTESFENSKPKSYHILDMRHDTIRNIYFYLAIIFLLILSLLIKLYSNFKKSNQEDIVKVSNFWKIIVIPFTTFVFAELLSANTRSNFFQLFGEAILIYLIVTPLFFLISHYLKLRSKLDFLYYILLFSLTIALIKEFDYLKQIAIL